MNIPIGTQHDSKAPWNGLNEDETLACPMCKSEDIKHIGNACGCYDCGHIEESSSFEAWIDEGYDIMGYYREINHK